MGTPILTHNGTGKLTGLCCIQCKVGAVWSTTRSKILSSLPSVTCQPPTMVLLGSMPAISLTQIRLGLVWGLGFCLCCHSRSHPFPGLIHLPVLLHPPKNSPSMLACLGLHKPTQSWSEFEAVGQLMYLHQPRLLIRKCECALQHVCDTPRQGI